MDMEKRWPDIRATIILKKFEDNLGAHVRKHHRTEWPWADPTDFNNFNP